MSVEAMSAVLNGNAVHSPSHKLVLLGIANHADERGANAYPGIPRLARYAEVSERRVQQILAELEAAGILRIEHRAGGDRDTRSDRRPNRYTIALDRLNEVQPTSPRTEVDELHEVQPASPGTGCNEVQPTSPGDAHEVKPSAPRGEAGFTQTVLEPSINPSTVSRSRNDRPPIDVEERQRIEALAEALVVGESPGMVNPRDAGTQALGRARALARDLPPTARPADVAAAFARARATWTDGVPNMRSIVKHFLTLTAAPTAPTGPPRIPDYVPEVVPDALPSTTNASRARQARALTRSTP